MNRQTVIQVGSVLVCTTIVLAGVTRGMRASAEGVSAKDMAKAQREAIPASGHDDRYPLLPAASTGGNGIVEPADREIKLAGDVAGRIAAILVKEGDQVAAGTVVAELEHGVEEAGLAAATADYAAAVADLNRTLHGQRLEDVESARADATAAQEREALSQGVYERTAKLARSGAATADELDRAKRQAASDLATFKSLKSRETAAVRGSRGEDIDAAKARVAATAARRDQAEAQLARLSIKTKTAGEILQLKARAGEYYNPGSSDPLLTMGDTSRLRVRLDIDERDITKVSLGQGAAIRVDAFPGQSFHGKVAELGRRMGRKNVRTDDPSERIDTKILEVVVDMDDAKGLMPGLRVTGYVEAGAAGEDPAGAKATAH